MSTKTASAAAIETDDGYARFEQLVRDRVGGVSGPVFETDADPDELWRRWLSNLPADRRQHYNCGCCRRFLQRFGRLVTIDANGDVHSVLFSHLGGVPGFFVPAATAVDDLVTKAGVTGPFLWSPKETTWGCPRTGDRTHLSGCPAAKPFLSPLQTAEQAMAEKRQDFQTLSHALADYPEDVAAQAARVLSADALSRSEKAAGVADWFLDLHRRLRGLKGPRRRNLVWAAVATAPVGFCHVRSTVVGTLLDDVKAGLDFAAIARRWQQKLHPLQYRRPTAAPTDTEIAAAEKTVETLGLAAAFARRFATLDDVLSFVWRPQPPRPQQSPAGLFGHLKSKQPPQPLPLPETRVTWTKFAREALPAAESMEVAVPARGNFYGLLTAADPAAPPLLQWDGLDGHPRNPVSSYVYVNGSAASHWRLQPTWTPVTAVFLPPSQWQEPERFRHQSGDRVHFALAGCRDSGQPHLCLFPEILRSDLHGVRRVIEAHSNKGCVPNGDEGTANGLCLSKGVEVVVRVRSAEGTATYRIDRFD